MFELCLWGSSIAIFVGVVLGLYVHFGDNDITIPPWEYAACGLVLLMVLVPAISFAGYELSLLSNTKFYEFWNGYEYATYTETYTCHESDSQGGSTGGCTHYYDCDSYTVEVDDPDTTDDDGTVHHHSHTETRYRQCPYTTTELSWIIETTVDNFNVGDHWLPSNPEQHRLQPAHDWTSSLPSYLDSGVPSPWTAATNRIASGIPAPVTALKGYKNYVLASKSQLLVAHSADVQTYEKQGLLPALTHDVYGVYFANRAYFVGVNVANQQEWQARLAKLNAAFGATEQGNLYVVVVDANKISRSDSESYLLALMASWESSKLGRYAVSKNALVVVLGTKDGQTVDWTRASTGMPKGNEFMLGDIERKVPGSKLDPSVLFGDPTVQLPITKNNDGTFTVNVNHNAPAGVIEQILWGPDHFERVPMALYAYLRGELTPTGWQLAGILFAVFLVSCAAWSFVCYQAVPAYHRFRGRRF